MNYSKDTYKKFLLAGICIMGLILLVIQHSLIGMYYDDYGNASLSYGYIANVNGTNWAVQDIIEWAKWCYNNWGGRILYASCILIPLLKDGIHLYMILQAIIITCIIFLMYKIICSVDDEQCSPIILGLIFLLWGLIGQDIHKFGTFWASASILYIWPLLPFFLSIYIYFISIKNVNSLTVSRIILINVLQVVLVFWATFSQEQVGLSVVAFFILAILFDHIKEIKKYLKFDTPVLIASVISYLILFFAPGNSARMDTTEFAEMNFIEKIIYNYPKVLNGFFYDGFKIFNILLACICIYMGFYLYKEKKHSKKFYGVIIIEFFQLLIAIYLAVWKKQNNQEIVANILMSLFMLNLIIITGIYFWRTKRFIIYALILSGGASAVCLLYSPSINARSYIEYIYIVFIVLGIVVADILKNSKKNAGYYIVLASLIALVPLASNNYIRITNGYYENDFYNRYNDKLLRNYNGEDIISLAKPVNAEYRTQMSCDEGFEYINGWMKEYYNIPQKTSIVWGNLTVDSKIRKEGDFYQDGWFGENGTIILSDFGNEKLRLNAYLPENYKNVSLLIATDEMREEYNLSAGMNTIEIKVPSVGDYTIMINAKGAQKSENGDERSLSCIITLG